MLKKVMFFLMAVYAAARFLGLSYTISTQADRLPAAVYIATGICVALGLFFLCKRIIARVRMRELELYYLLTGLAAVFNLIYVKCVSRFQATPVDLLVIGTVLDVVVSVTLIVLAEKERKYVRIPVGPEK